jgi:hypothetical protein
MITRPVRSVFSSLGRLPRTALLAAVAAMSGGSAPADIADTGVAVVPQDAAFLSATLRAREQYDRLVGSRAFAAVRELPAVRRLLDQIEQQQNQPGNPLAMVGMFMQLPENQQALELLADMIASDTFVYGEPTCVTFMELISKLQQAQNAANVLGMVRKGGSSLRVDLLPGQDGIDLDDAIPADAFAGRLALKALADNIDLLVMPDLVWGFKTEKREAAQTQLKRLEVLLALLTQGNPDLADAVESKTIGKGEFVTFTYRPDPELLRQSIAGLEGLEQERDTVLARVAELRVVVALGTVGDRVILSLGGGDKHLAKLAADDGLLATKPFQPLTKMGTRPVTAVSYLSESFARSLAPSAEDLEELSRLTDVLAESAGLSKEAAAEARTLIGKVSEGYAKRLPVPGPWMAFSFFGEQGYEGYVHDWNGNLPYDGSQRLDLLGHMGGTPLAALALRVRPDAAQFEDLVSWAALGWKFLEQHLLPSADEDVQENFGKFNRHIAPLGTELVDILRQKFLPALADGQFGLVLDAKSTTKRLHEDLPATADPLPVLEPAFLLGIDDKQLFREGLSDLFALGDKLVAAVREMDADAVPEGYQIPAPEKQDVSGGSVWSFAIPDARLDQQIQPSIAVGDDVAAFALVKGQAGRLLQADKLATGKNLSALDGNLAGAAAVDWVGFVDAIEPWVVYLVRYASAQQQSAVDRDTTLDADVETPQVKDALKQVGVILDIFRCLKSAVAETTAGDGMTVTHWRNEIRDLESR